MEMTRILVALVLLAPASGIASEKRCYQADQDSGRLEFHGAVEGTEFTGRFEDFDVRYCLAGDALTDGKIDVRVRTASADSNNSDRDEELMTENFFFVEKYPEATWKSSEIRPNCGGGEYGYVAGGVLEIRGIASDQAVDFEAGRDGDAFRVNGSFRMFGETEINRQDFDVGLGEFADPEFVRNRVDVNFDLELTPEN